MTAARIGPSAAIINQVAAKGIQKMKIFLYASDSFSAIIAIQFNGKWHKNQIVSLMFH
jgi:hypothetical protein